MGRTAVVVLLIAVAALSGCSGGDDGDNDVVVTPATSTVVPVPSVTATAAATPTAAPSPAPPPAGTPTATSTPMPSPAPTGEPRAAPTHSGDVGVPLSASDVAEAVELDGRGYSFWLIGDRAPICSGSAVLGRPHWSANLAGSDFGPVFVLWVYPDVDALQQDWEVTPGEPPRARFDGCDLSLVYWNENLVMAFEVWLSLGEDVPLAGHGESPGDHPAVRAFLGLAP